MICLFVSFTKRRGPVAFRHGTPLVVHFVAKGLRLRPLAAIRVDNTS
ncbi:hypothetical protein HMPREF1868_01635 [Olsenella sp. DNF00959]|nr:hypothetical protein HMPREF1868_01635 [Olsenella sp. DNF00959]